MSENKLIKVYAGWQGLKGSQLMGFLGASNVRGKEIFSFEYHQDWLKSKHMQIMDPNVKLFSGPQYLQDTKPNFGMFMDSAPDRWGRVLMTRKEAMLAREQKRSIKKLQESDFLLGVYDDHRMGALRLKLDEQGDFLSNDKTMTVPPFSKLRSLEQACLKLEGNINPDNQETKKWLNMLMAPGSSLGGARPKSGVVDENKNLWIAKFPSRADDRDMGAWEMVTHDLAVKAGITAPEARLEKFTHKYHTYLTRRFDRNENDQRIHFASAMTLLGYNDGADASAGVSYLELAEFIIQNGSRVNKDLEELWRRIVFNICVTNTDDHLRNHGFLLTEAGWVLSPVYDVNPVESGFGLTLNISEDDNALDFNLALEVGEYFRLTSTRAKSILKKVKRVVANWPELASKYGISKQEQSLMRDAFRLG